MTFGLGMELAWDRPGVGTGRWAALLALAFVAFAPGAVQQGHFYIVDGFFTAIALAGLWVIVRAVQGGGWHWFVLAGLFVGALGAVRFNGLALGVVLLAGHLARPGEGVLRRLRAAEQWVGRRVGAGAGIGATAYLWVNPFLLGLDTHADFALAIRITRLEILQP